MDRPIFLLLIACLALAMSVWGIAQLWADLGVHMSLHGWIAYGLGAGASIALAGGLFFLTFKSSRDGYDDIERREDLTE